MSVFPGPDEPRRGGGREAEGIRAPAPTPTGSGHTAPLASRPAEDEIDNVNRVLQLAFAPLHKRAFGIAIGTACALFIFVFSAVHVMFDIPGALRLELLRAYFRGYSVTWAGTLIGAVWAFGIGFIAGWFLAFCRNMVIAISVFLTRTRAELRQTREFLDHI